jgi:SAM-dependent methyltransferase
MDKLKVLDIGSGCGGPEFQINYFLEHLKEKEIVRLDVNPETHPDILHDITKELPEEYKNAFDIVFCSHVLEHMARDEVFPVLRNMASALKNMGEIYILVPSLEWAAKEILMHHDGIQIQGLIFGAQYPGNPWELHKSGFTLHALRYMAELCGLLIKKAYQSPFVLIMPSTTKNYPAVQNVLIAARYDGLHEPRPAEPFEIPNIELPNPELKEIEK